MSDEGGRPAELFQLDRATCLALLGTQRVGRLVVGHDDPAVIPLNYRVLDAAIVFRTEPGGGADGPTDEPVVFEVDMFDDRTRSGWSVVVHGRLLPFSAEDAGAVVTWAPGPRDRWLQIPVDTVTGRLLRGAVDAPRADQRGYL
jgi:nitroimidazol reductase NimA-like FMN-containing flavoprotein (pyridoxamine 5'-phosphate oxidase superfamily)